MIKVLICIAFLGLGANAQEEPVLDSGDSLLNKVEQIFNFLKATPDLPIDVNHDITWNFQSLMQFLF